MCDGPADRSSFTRPAMMRGYHDYYAIREAYIGEELSCLLKTDNEHDRYAVSIIKSATVVDIFLEKYLHCSLS